MPIPATSYTDLYSSIETKIITTTFLCCFGMGYFGGFYAGESKFTGISTIKVNIIYTDLYH